LKKFFSRLLGEKPIFNPDGPPAHIGDYSVVREIGVGVTSKVYLGIHKKTMVSVAIKLLRKECAPALTGRCFEPRHPCAGA
jgi:hypothetical protein